MQNEFKNRYCETFPLSNFDSLLSPTHLYKLLLAADLELMDNASLFCFLIYPYPWLYSWVPLSIVSYVKFFLPTGLAFLSWYKWKVKNHLFRKYWNRWAFCKWVNHVIFRDGYDKFHLYELKKIILLPQLAGIINLPHFRCLLLMFYHGIGLRHLKNPTTVVSNNSVTTKYYPLPS